MGLNIRVFLIFRTFEFPYKQFTILQGAMLQCSHVHTLKRLELFLTPPHFQTLNILRQHCVHTSRNANTAFLIYFHILKNDPFDSSDIAYGRQFDNVSKQLNLYFLI